ncbi:hypothetical protein [Thiolapillus sp.]|uniref:MBL fold metallo-hydrolase n=1 Tax=Thiolapillus sp. TaxID=2017437 RepID=UPI003AF44B6E
MIDFGTSQSPKSTRPLTTYWCPSSPGHQALRNNFASSLLLRTWLPYDWTPCSEAYFVFPLAQGTPGKQCGLAATGVYQPSLRSPWLAALVVLLGCGHSGVINTLEYIQQISGIKNIHAVMGGMHLLHATAERLAFTGENLQQFSIHYLAPNHCTGLNAVCYFKSRFPDAFHKSKTGTTHLFINK